ncbi:N-alpha-acetyltransferase 40-like [Pollicipes pollicipes]|uniref:N-alpha-acetyltransferase 40-like n=1 Tax=Pollicipes pollicipes TaxID=41117 RepID=UPI0018855FAE|nr:N-alpha-acetyltransferase 40-like [Pollicipes pollicipes]
MGRESEKARQRKMARRAEKERLAASGSLVKLANSVPDLMAELAAFRRYDRRGVSVALEHRNVGDLSDAELDAMLTICRDNMRALYNSCEWGWNDKEKRGEMTESMAKYLVARDGDSKIVAFCHFRFDLDYDDEVVYCYEIQLTKPYQRSGLGKFMMSILELMAFKKQMLYVRLTVLKHNDVANNFFKSCGYVRDKTCLDDTIYQTYCYEILSKKNPRREDVNVGNVPQISVSKSQQQSCT